MTFKFSTTQFQAPYEYIEEMKLFSCHHFLVTDQTSGVSEFTRNVPPGHNGAHNGD